MKTGLFLRLVIMLLLCMGLVTLHAQSDRRVSVSVGVQIDATSYDQFRANNATGFGPNLKAFVKLAPRFDALLELNGDLFGGTKVAVLDANGNYVEGKDGVVGIQGGLAFKITNGVRAALTAGTAIFGGESHFAFRPGLIFIPGSKRLRLHASFTNVSQDVPGNKADFGYFSFGINFRVI